MDTRSELLALRAEFKELTQCPDAPWATLTQTGDRRRWLVRGFRVAGFEALALRAAAVAGQDGIQGWLELIGDGKLEYQGRGRAGESVLVISHLNGIAQLSVLAIDRLLAKHSSAPSAPPPEINEAGENGDAFNAGNLPAEYREGGKPDGVPLVVPYLTESVDWQLSANALAGARSRSVIQSVKVRIDGKVKDAHEFVSLAAYRLAKTRREDGRE